MSINERTCFQLYHNFFNQFKLLDMNDRGLLITAIFEYAKDQSISVSLTPITNMAFSYIKDTLDRDRKKYIETCEKNAQNGKKGGRPRKNTLDKKTERFFEKPKKADKDMDMDKDKDKDKDMDKDMDMDMDMEEDKDTDKEKNDFPKAPLPPPDSVPKRKKDNNFIFDGEERSYSLNEEDIRALTELGVPRDYVSEREKRALQFSKSKKMPAFEILLEWWESDKSSGKWAVKASTDPDENHEKSYDLDEFFMASVRRSFEEFDRRYPEKAPSE